MTTSFHIPINSGFKGFVAGVIDADYKQRAYFELWIDGKHQASATFEGQGIGEQMKNVFNQKGSWSFGPINKDGYIRVRITHFDGSKEIDSKMVGPLSIRKEPEFDYPTEFYISTVISDDSVGDQSNDDCTIIITEYKLE